MTHVRIFTTGEQEIEEIDFSEHHNSSAPAHLRTRFNSLGVFEKWVVENYSCELWRVISSSIGPRSSIGIQVRKKQDGKIVPAFCR